VTFWFIIASIIAMCYIVSLYEENLFDKESVATKKYEKYQKTKLSWQGLSSDTATFLNEIEALKLESDYYSMTTILPQSYFATIHGDSVKHGFMKKEVVLENKGNMATFKDGTQIIVPKKVEKSVFYYFAPDTTYTKAQMKRMVENELLKEVLFVNVPVYGDYMDTENQDTVKFRIVIADMEDYIISKDDESLVRYVTHWGYMNKFSIFENESVFKKLESWKKFK